MNNWIINLDNDFANAHTQTFMGMIGEKVLGLDHDFQGIWSWRDDHGGVLWYGKWDLDWQGQVTNMHLNDGWVSFAPLSLNGSTL